MGNNANAPAGPDLAGNPRFVHTFVDMGAYEFQDSPPADFDGDGMATTDERIAGSDSAWAYQFEKLKEVEVIDDRSGVIHLTEPFAPF